MMFVTPRRHHRAAEPRRRRPETGPPPKRHTNAHAVEALNPVNSSTPAANPPSSARRRVWAPGGVLRHERAGGMSGSSRHRDGALPAILCAADTVTPNALDMMMMVYMDSSEHQEVIGPANAITGPIDPSNETLPTERVREPFRLSTPRMATAPRSRGRRPRRTRRPLPMTPTASNQQHVRAATHTPPAGSSCPCEPPAPRTPQP